MAPMEHAHLRARPAKGRAWVGNLLAVIFVLAVAGFAALVTSQQVEQARREHAARTAFEARLRTPATRPSAAATETLPLVIEMAGSVLVLAMAGLLIARRRARVRPVEMQAKWVGEPRQSAAQLRPGALAAWRLSAIVRDDRIAGQQDARRRA